MTADQQKIRDVKRKYEQQWLSINGVVGVGIGVLDNQDLGIIISVAKSDQRISQKIPEEIEGVKIEIRETGEFKAL